MALILIPRGFFSGGQVIAECLGKSAAITAVTREDLIASANRHGEIANKMTASIGRATQNYAGSVSLFRNLTTKQRVVMTVTALMFARDRTWLVDVPFFAGRAHGHTPLNGE